MQLAKILQEIDLEIARLEQAKALLSGASVSKAKSGRSAKTSLTTNTAPAKGKTKRNLTPEGRKRIAEAVKRRWELQKKNSSK